MVFIVFCCVCGYTTKCHRKMDLLAYQTYTIYPSSLLWSTLWWCNIAIENDHFEWNVPLNMVMFHRFLLTFTMSGMVLTTRSNWWNPHWSFVNGQLLRFKWVQPAADIEKCHLWNIKSPQSTYQATFHHSWTAKSQSRKEHSLLGQPHFHCAGWFFCCSTKLHFWSFRLWKKRKALSYKQPQTQHKDGIIESFCL